MNYYYISCLTTVVTNSLYNGEIHTVDIGSYVIAVVNMYTNQIYLHTYIYTHIPNRYARTPEEFPRHVITSPRYPLKMATVPKVDRIASFPCQNTLPNVSIYKYNMNSLYERHSTVLESVFLRYTFLEGFYYVDFFLFYTFSP